VPGTSTKKQQSSTFDEEQLQVDIFHAKMNGKIHKQSKLITDADANCPYDVFQFDVEATIASIDPLLWRIIVSLPGVSHKPERELNQTKLVTNVNYKAFTHSV